MPHDPATREEYMELVRERVKFLAGPAWRDAGHLLVPLRTLAADHDMGRRRGFTRAPALREGDLVNLAGDMRKLHAFDTHDCCIASHIIVTLVLHHGMDREMFPEDWFRGAFPGHKKHR